jgi:hypothetical protein
LWPNTDVTSLLPCGIVTRRGCTVIDIVDLSRAQTSAFALVASLRGHPTPSGCGRRHDKHHLIRLHPAITPAILSKLAGDGRSLRKAAASPIETSRVAREMVDKLVETVNPMHWNP